MGAEKPKEEQKNRSDGRQKPLERAREKREREQNTSGKIAAGKESCYLLPALHFLAAWESNAHAGTLIQFCFLYGAARIDVN